jgi:hypothetical protein
VSRRGPSCNLIPRNSSSAIGLPEEVEAGANRAGLTAGPGPEPSRSNEVWLSVDHCSPPPPGLARLTHVVRADCPRI